MPNFIFLFLFIRTFSSHIMDTHILQNGVQSISRHLQIIILNVLLLERDLVSTKIIRSAPNHVLFLLRHYKMKRCNQVL